MSPSRRTFLSAAGLLACLPAAPGWAQSLGEARVKVRLALVLARFTQWPADALGAPGEPFQMCVLGRTDTLSGALAEIDGQTVAGRPVRLNLQPDRNLSGCHLLFVQGSAGRASAAALAASPAAPILTIADDEGFAARGGMVELVNVNDTLRLDINLRALRNAQLVVSSQVLKLALQLRE